LQVLTISADSPDVIKKRLGVHGLRNQLIHSGPSGEDLAEALPVPTTILVDANGKVLWMEYADSDQWRSGPEVVLAAIQTHLDGASGRFI
jgi:peroxiredoxin